MCFANQYLEDDEPVCPQCNDQGCEYCEDVPEDDGQPDEHTEWQDVFGGDEDPHDYDRYEGAEMDPYNEY